MLSRSRIGLELGTYLTTIKRVVADDLRVRLLLCANRDLKTRRDLGLSGTGVSYSNLNLINKVTT